MPRTITLSDEGVDEFVVAVLKNDLENIESELMELSNKQHTEDRKHCKKMRKHLIRVINHFSSPDQKIPE